MRARKGFGFVEIIVATLIAAVCSIPIIMMVSSSRSETSKAINYLRAMELANEALEWAMIATDTANLDTNLSGCGGSLIVDVGGGTLGPADVDTIDPLNPKWDADGIISRDIGYSDQYNTAYFLRSISVVPVTSGMGAGYMSEVRVEVKWNEGRAPTNLMDPAGDRMRKITLTTLVTHDNRIDY
ncbi:MAG: hypothetical protein BWY66_02439 [bacterium ADurb.Bin374]|nr:MAG: hypothetical protein BWY66_02439 [bacterium ADurb.Bin374]